MPQTKCPHCGLANFDISAYCARCERPLRDAAGAPSEPEVGQDDDTRVTFGADLPPSLPAKWGASPSAKTDEVPLRRDPGTSRMPPALQRRAPPRAAAPRSASPAAPKGAYDSAPKSAYQAAPHSADTVIRAVALGDGPLPYGLAPGARQRPLPLERPVPPATAEAAPEVTEIPTAAPGLWRLALAATVDGLLGAALSVAAVLLETAVFAGQWPVVSGGFLEALAEWLHLNPGTALRGGLLWLLFGLVYSTAGAQRGQTVGRWLWRLVLVDRRGTTPSWGRAALRSVCGLFSALVGGAGFFYVVVDSRRRAWHDMLTQTQVVLRR